MSEITVPKEAIVSKIYDIRGQKVMLDRDLAKLYNVETKALKQAVRRNLNRFPSDFMFEMNKDEFSDWRSQFVTSKEDRSGLRYAPFCFTEQGVSMLSSVLNSDQAIAMNIQIMRTFTKMREMLLTHNEIITDLKKIKDEVGDNSKDIELIFKYLEQLEAAKEQNKKQQNRRRIGYIMREEK